MIELHIKNHVTRLIAPTITMKEISDILSYEVPGAHFAMRGMPKGAWDGRKRLMGKDGSFPAGLTAMVLGFLLKEKLKIDKTVDLRVRPLRSLDLKLATGIEPRDYQEQASRITDERVRGIFNIGTGGGKTIISTLITQRRGVPTLFVTPDTGLLSQTYEIYCRFFGRHNVSKDLTSDCPIVLTNIHQIDGYVPTKCRKTKKRLEPKKDPKHLARFHMLIVDEFHHAASDRYLQLNRLASGAYWRYGLTGTFIRPDGRDLVMMGVLSNMLLTKSTSDLIEDGWLVPADVLVHSYRARGMSKMNYKVAYTEIVNSIEFNNFVASRVRVRVRDEQKQTLVLVRYKQHGNLLKDMLGGDAMYVDGDDPTEKRERVKALFAEKKIRCLIATNIFGEGQDIPAIDCLINARLQESEIQTKQGIGRALRLAKGARNYEESVAIGKSRAYVEDFLVTGNSHLKRHSLSRIEQYRSERGFNVQIME